jgi:hypothetical protein
MESGWFRTKNANRNKDNSSGLQKILLRQTDAEPIPAAEHPLWQAGEITK